MNINKHNVTTQYTGKTLSHLVSQTDRQDELCVLTSSSTCTGSKFKLICSATHHT